MKKFLCLSLTVVFFVAIFMLSSGEIKATAASYPLVYDAIAHEDVTPVIPKGETGKLVFTIFPEYKNENLYVEIYDENDTKVAYSTVEYYNYSIMFREQTISVDTDELDMEVGEYKVVYWMDYYSFQEWHSIPRKKTSYIKVIKNVCKGKHDLKFKEHFTEADCESDGYDIHKCSKCEYYRYKKISGNHKFCEWENLSETQHERICTVCSEKEVSNHRWNEGVITTSPTETTQGIRTFTCLDCAATYNQSFDMCASNSHIFDSQCDSFCNKCGYEREAMSHIPGDWIVDKKATTTEEGEKHRECIVCKSVLETGRIEKLKDVQVPVISSAKVTTSGVKITWGAVENAVQYKVYRKTYDASTKKWDSKWKRIKTLSGTEYTDGTVKLGTKYKYLIKAVNGDVTKNSKSTSTIEFKISPTPKAYLKSNGIKIKWSLVVSATEYRVYRAEYNASKKKYGSYKKVATLNGSTKEWTDTKVTSGKKYKYCIKAVNGKVVCSKKSISEGLYYLTKPKATVTKATNGIVVSWNAVKGASKYRVYRSELQNGVWTSFKEIATPNGKNTSYTDTTAVVGVQYKYKVKAVKSKSGITSSETAVVMR